MRSVAALAALATCAIVGSCAPGNSSSGTGTVSPTGSARASRASPLASVETEVTVGGERPVTLWIPSTIPDGGAPLLILLHGYGASGAEQDGYLRLSRIASERGMLYAHPDGTRDREGNRFWNATDACCDRDRTGVEDSAYVHDLIEEIDGVADVDRRRSYLVGHSNGGFMAYRVACEHADLIAALASLAGATFAQAGDCRPTETVAVLEIHGTADDVVLFEGGELSDIVGLDRPSPTYPGAEETVEIWAAYDGCAADLVDTGRTVDVDAHLDGPDGPMESTIRASTACDDGGHAELWTIPRGGHVPDVSQTFAESVVEFLLAHPKP